MQHPTLLFQNRPIANGEIHFYFEDSILIRNFVQNQLGLRTNEMFQTLMNDAPWIDPDNDVVRYRGRRLPREKCYFVPGNQTRVQLLDQPPDILFKYGFPGFSYASMLHYRPFESVPLVAQLVQNLQQLTYNGSRCNTTQIIGTRYAGARENISYHSDKILDITPDTPIISISLGETREMHLGRPDSADAKKTIFEHAIQLHAGDLFILGPLTNRNHRHAIVPVSEELLLQRPADEAVQPRISLVARDISTRVSLAEVKQKHLKK